MSAARLLLALGALHRAAAEAIAFLGSGGCDGQNKPPCVDHPDEEKILWTMYLSKFGELKPVAKLPVEGLPVWLTPAKDDKCLLVSLADVSKMVSFVITPSGRLQQVGESLDSHGLNPVHATVSSDGNTLVVANYRGPDDGCNSTGAGVASFAIGDDCSLAFSDSKPHSGSSTIHDRQCSAHVHSVTAGRDMLAFACDLGMDLVFTYRIGADGKLTELARTHSPPGSGPRHTAIHPTEPFIYVIHEMGSMVIAYKVQEDGSLAPLAEPISTQPADQLSKGYGSKAAEIVISPDGTKLYASNRAFADGFASTVVSFDVQADGTLRKPMQHEVATFPRGMAQTSDGALLIVEGQQSGVVETYHTTNGLFAKTGFSVQGPNAAAAVAIIGTPEAPVEQMHV